ncbi:MAG: hypothetical protein EZS28_005742 [Streblomastix strix]|uniref:Uncharacterized protein n=1 Tax=Streblomastix strix TaxID=222440 RepID=A0A5J4WVB5_9EUKA|nr:MAG: hypothetical protein EZS28_005742 [Streblomastix strix]
METTIEVINEVESEYIEQYVEERSVGRSKKYFNDDDRKEANRQQYLATKGRYKQKKAQINKDDMSFVLEWLATKLPPKVQTDIEQKIIQKNN